MLDLSYNYTPVYDTASTFNWDGPYSTRVEFSEKTPIKFGGKTLDYYFKEVKEFLINGKGEEAQVEHFQLTEENADKKDAGLWFNIDVYFVDGSTMPVGINEISIDEDIVFVIEEKIVQGQPNSSEQIAFVGEPAGVNSLPALGEIVINPKTNVPSTVKDAIMNLNDGFKWTREEIADWLETLDIDLQFKID